MELHKHEIKRITVTDNWFPCFEGNQVIVHIHVYKFDDDVEYNVLISAHGADDFGVELRYRSAYKTSALSVYDFWKMHIFDKIPNGITVMWFYEHGFIPG